MPRLQRQLQTLRHDLEQAVSPPLAAELRRILPPQDAAPTAGALRIECAVLLVRLQFPAGVGAEGLAPDYVAQAGDGDDAGDCAVADDDGSQVPGQRRAVEQRGGRVIGAAT
jgi:hypothetical protein